MANGTSGVRPEDVKTVIGIKAVKSKKTGNIWYTYYVTNAFSNYELENSEFCEGVSCESVGSGVDFGLNIGDKVEFNYGRAIGDFQPVKSVTIVSLAAEGKK